MGELKVLKTDISNKVDYCVFDKTVHQLQTEITSLKGVVSQLQSALILKADKDDLISQINLSPEGVYIQGKNIQLDGDVIKFKKKPSDKIVSGTLNGNKMDIINIKEEK